MKEAMKLALEALQNELSIDWTNNEEFNASAEQMYAAIKALEEALAKQEHEHERFHVATIGNWGRIEWVEGIFPSVGDKMYSAPPQGDKT